MKNPLTEEGKLYVASKGKKGKDRKQQAVSYCEHKHSNGYVPAKIVALFIDPEDGIEMAIVQACQLWMQKNYDCTSAIMESWHLQYIRDTGSLHLRPLLNVIEKATQFKERIYVVEETPGIHESLLEKIQWTCNYGH